MDLEKLWEEGKSWFKKDDKKTSSEKKEKKKSAAFSKRTLLSGSDSLKELAEELGLPTIPDIPSLELPRDFYKKIPYTFIKKHTVLPYKKEGETLIVAVSDPLSLEPIEELRLMLGTAVSAVFCPKERILEAINSCYNKESGAASQLIAHMDRGSSDLEDEEGVDAYDLLDDSREHSPIVKLLNLIFTEAIQQNASDIHFEPHENELFVRYRIDGVLHTRHSPASEYQAQLLTRIKVMAKMDIAERRLPQDGRIKLRMGGREIDFRVSTVPVVAGERIVLRILDKGNVHLGMEHIGMPEDILTEFNRLARLPEGILLVTGPTGSGKTTTLYSTITDLATDEVNIMTIEDPVEYYLGGIAQIGVKPKIDLTFSAGLRHILRQDPDIILVGEIRDLETAEIAIQASLTGHLVLSTLHTNDAPSAVTRLVDMGIEPYLLSSSLVGVMAQRLVRKICPHCKTRYKPTEEELKSLGLEATDELYHGTGCEHCFQSGYLGRTPVYELLTITPKLQHQIVKSPDATEIRKACYEEGMKNLSSRGADLVKAGVTTIEEVLRVIRMVNQE